MPDTDVRTAWFGHDLSYYMRHDTDIEGVVALCLYNYAISVAAADPKWAFPDSPYIQVLGDKDGDFTAVAWFAEAFDSTGDARHADYVALLMDRAQRTFDGTA